MEKIRVFIMNKKTLESTCFWGYAFTAFGANFFTYLNIPIWYKCGIDIHLPLLIGLIIIGFAMWLRWYQNKHSYYHSPLICFLLFSFYAFVSIYYYYIVQKL